MIGRGARRTARRGSRLPAHAPGAGRQGGAGRHDDRPLDRRAGAASNALSRDELPTLRRLNAAYAAAPRLSLHHRGARPTRGRRSSRRCARAASATPTPSSRRRSNRSRIITRLRLGALLGARSDLTASKPRHDRPALTRRSFLPAGLALGGLGLHWRRGRAERASPRRADRAGVADRPEPAPDDACDRHRTTVRRAPA